MFDSQRILTVDKRICDDCRQMIVISKNNKQPIRRKRRELKNLLNTEHDGKFIGINRRQFGVNGIALKTNVTIVFLLLIVFILCMLAIMSTLYTEGSNFLLQKFRMNCLLTSTYFLSIGIVVFSLLTDAYTMFVILS